MSTDDKFRKGPVADPQDAPTPLVQGGTLIQVYKVNIDFRAKIFSECSFSR